MKLLQLVTGEDNATLEPAYFWTAIVMTVGLVLEVYCVLKGKPFDLQSYGVGAGCLLGGLGLSAKLGK